MDSSNPEPICVIRPGLRKAVTGVSWSPVRENVLAITHFDEPGITLWNTKDPTAPFQARSASASVTSLSWQPTTALRAGPALSDNASWEEVIDRAVPNRLLVATRAGFEELSLHGYKPLAISRADGLLLGCGRVLVSYGLPQYLRTDSVVMRERAQAGYSVDIGRNIQVRFLEVHRMGH